MSHSASVAPSSESYDIESQIRKACRRNIAKLENRKETYNLGTSPTRDVSIRTMEQEPGLRWPVVSEEVAANRESVQHVSITTKTLSENIPE